MVKSISLAVAASAALTMAMPAEAIPTITNQANCLLTTPDPDAVACSGFWDANLLNSSPNALLEQQAALKGIGYNFDTSTYHSLQSQSSLSGGLLNFGQTLYGLTYIAVNFTDASLGDRTIFYAFNFSNGGASAINLNTTGFSSAVLYRTNLSAVPEPATWAMMVIGFAGIGAAFGRRRNRALAQLD